MSNYISISEDMLLKLKKLYHDLENTENKLYKETDKSLKLQQKIIDIEWDIRHIRQDLLKLVKEMVEDE